MATKPGKPSAPQTATSEPNAVGSPSADVIQAQINHSLAASRKLVASWLPKPGPTEQVNVVSEVPLQPTVGRLGVGATATTSQKMIARGPLSGLLPSKRRPSGEEATSSKRPSDSRGGQDEDSDDEEDRGRSSIADQSKKRKTGHTIVAKSQPHAKPIPSEGGLKTKKKKKKAAARTDG